MPTTSATLVASTIMDTAASLNNDTAKSNYTYTVQIPYLNIALRELQELFEQNDVPVTSDYSTVIQVDANIDHVGFSPTPAGTDPYLPNDLIEPDVLWERTRNVNPYIPMTRVDFLPRYMDGSQISQLVFYVWESQELRFLPANANNDIRMNYTRKLFTTITLSTDSIGVVNAQSFLEFRTGGLCAKYIGEDDVRAQMLNNDASLALDRSMGISTKGRQAIFTRHRPFRSGYKQRAR